jgi:hypothetical protein
MKMDNLDLLNDMYTKISDIKFKSDLDTNIKVNNNKPIYLEDNSLNYRTNLDYLLYDEKPLKSKNKLKNKKKNNNKESLMTKYFIMFILFCVLNSYYVINILNKQNISYRMSIAIRGLIFILGYHLIKKIE